VPVVAVTGPIASGKTTVTEALAQRLRDSGSTVAAIDLDLVYEMLADPEVRKDDQTTWARSRRMAGALAAALMRDGVKTVAIEAQLASASARRELAEAAGELPFFITLRTSLQSALTRVEGDPTRTFSRDRGFLTLHYRSAARWPSFDGDLVFDTEATGVDEIVRAIVAHVAEPGV
jgi:adenylylsulfate kinase-like enzyme